MCCDDDKSNLTFGIVPEADNMFGKLFWLLCNADVELVRIRQAVTIDCRSVGNALLFKCVARNSKFSRSNAACCNFNSLIADINSNFCVSSDERDSISYTHQRNS